MSAPFLTSDAKFSPSRYLHFSFSHKMFFSLSIRRCLIWGDGFSLEFALGAFPADNCFGGRYIRFVDRFDISLQIALPSRRIPIASRD